MLRWKGGCDFAVKFTGFLCFTGEMTDTPESSEHINVEETSIVEEGLHLVDTVDDPAPSWVGPPLVVG